MHLTVYLAGEIHSAWRDDIKKGIAKRELPVDVLAPVTNHDASDNVGSAVLGEESNAFWRDRKSASINAMRTRTALERADIVVVKFGEKYRQWNAAFDAGYAAAIGAKIIVIHPPEFNHALKEVDAAALAVAQDEQQVIDILSYVCGQE